MLTAGINAAPLLAPKTGVGRYIAGLLSGFEALAGSAAASDFQARPLFGPARGGGQRGVGADGDRRGPQAEARSPLHLARALAKALPGGRALAEAGRALALEKLRRDRAIDLFHETNHAAPRTRLPVVLTVHDLCTLLFPETQEPARARHFGKVLRERTREAAQVIAPTQAIARQLVELLGVEKSRVRAIHHGLDPELLERLGQPGAEWALTPRPPLLSQRGVAGPYLLFVGALEPRKGVPTLLDAWDALPERIQRELPLVLAGPPERIERALESRLARRRPGQLVQLGYTQPEDLPGLYAHAAMLAMPSIYEGFGLPLLEAMACGLPCAISDDPALCEVAAGAALVSPRGDAPALAESLARLYDDAVLRAQKIDQGRARAAAFSWVQSASEHLAAYREAL